MTPAEVETSPKATEPETDIRWAWADAPPDMDFTREALFRHIGQPVRRKEDRRLVTGKSRFTDDFTMPGQVYASLVRSPYPHARILSINTANASAAPGVLAVLSGADALRDGLSPIPHNPLPKTRFDMKLSAPDGGSPFLGPHLLLPHDKVRHVGEAVVMVVAETAAQASDAAEQVVVDYDELDFVLDALDAASGSSKSTVWDEVPDNVFIENRFGDWAATDAAFAAAEHVVEADFHIDRVTGVPIEPRAALAEFEPETGKYTLYAGSGGAVRQKSELAEVLGIPPADLRVLSFDVGGNFGTRNRVYIEFGLVLWAARKIGRPVKFTATRSEAFLTDYQGRDLHTKVALAIDANGQFLAMRADNLSNVGARCVSLSPLSKGSGLITGSYAIPVAALRSRAVFTNTMCTQAYRSSGRPEVTYAIERLVDLAADQIGMDGLELRRRNLIPAKAMPYRNAVGQIYDSGTYEENMDKAMALFDWDGFPARRAAAERKGLLLGRGLANYVESSIGSPKERAEISVLPQGRVEVVIGTQPSGQGHETSFAQVVADMLGVAVERISIIMGDTDLVSLGGGSHSGRSMRHAGTVMAMASAELLAQARHRAARHFAVPVDQIERDGDQYRLQNTNHSIDLFGLAGIGNEPLAVAKTNEMHTPVFPNGTAICEISIDPELGHAHITRYATIDDVGRCINPLIVHGQTHGGIAQGVGQAMWELCAVDPNSGQPLAGSFMDYVMPRADNLPFFDAEISEVISPTNPLGIKAGGEGGTTPALATVTLAVLDALKPFGVRDIKMPLSSNTIWRAIQDARAQQSKNHQEDSSA